MKTIIVISPCYLNAAFQEVKGFSFGMQGYGNFAQAKQRIIRNNSLDVLGFAFLGDTLPRKGSTEFKNMEEFLKECNLMVPAKKFVIVTKGDIPGYCIKLFKQCSNIRFFSHTGFEFVTDAIIRENVFGSLLMDNYEPYRLRVESTSQLSAFVCPTSSISPIINDYVLNCLSNVTVLDNVHRTIIHDKVYADYKECNSPLARIRELYIRREFGEDISTELKALYESLSSDAQDTTSWCMQFVLVKRLMGGDILGE